MKRYLPGILAGVVLSALLAVAIVLATSEQRRQQLSARLEEMRKAFPDGKQLKQSVQKVASSAREAGSNLGDQMQISTSKLGQRTQEMVSTARQTAGSLGARLQARGSDLVNSLNNRE